MSDYRNQVQAASEQIYAILGYPTDSVNTGIGVIAKQRDDAIKERDTLRTELAAANEKAARDVAGWKALYEREKECSNALDEDNISLRAELAAVVERAQKREHSLSSSVATLGNENARLRAELDAERERKEHYQTLFKDMVPQAVALRAALVKAGEALKIVVASHGPWIKGTKQQIALTEIRKLTGENDEG